MTRGIFRAFGRDRRGVAAVEFALIAPLMVGFYLGMVEVCAGFMAQKRMSHVTALVADLVAQEQAVSTENIDGIFMISSVVMQPFSGITLSQRVRSVTLVDGVAQVDWTYKTTGGGDFGDDATITLPDDLITEGQSVIVSDAIYDFHSPVRYLVPGGLKFEAIYFLRPRIVEQIPCSNC